MESDLDSTDKLQRKDSHLNSTNPVGLGLAQHSLVVADESCSGNFWLASCVKRKRISRKSLRSLEKPPGIPRSSYFLVKLVYNDLIVGLWLT